MKPIDKYLLYSLFSNEFHPSKIINPSLSGNCAYRKIFREKSVDKDLIYIYILSKRIMLTNAYYQFKIRNEVCTKD